VCVCRRSEISTARTILSFILTDLQAEGFFASVRKLCLKGAETTQIEGSQGCSCGRWLEKATPLTYLVPMCLSGALLFAHPVCRMQSFSDTCTVPNAVSRLFRMSRYAIADWNAMFDAMSYQVMNGRVMEHPILICMYYVIQGYIFVHWPWSVMLKGRLLAEGTEYGQPCPCRLPWENCKQSYGQLRPCTLPRETCTCNQD
jgi:hypothetical protein